MTPANNHNHPPIADRNDPNSEDWRYFALQLAALHQRIHAKCKNPKCEGSCEWADCKNKCTNPECVALIKAVRQAADFGA